MSYSPFSLQNKTILITGASSGIGKATAIECSRMGATLVITARNKDRLNETLMQLEGSNHQIIVADLATDDGVVEVCNKCPKINGLVNNAGISSFLPVNFITREKLNEIFPINLESPILLFSKLLKMRKLGKGSSTVFTSSINGVMGGGIAESLYSASKGALSGFVKSASLELAVKEIRVNCICPGLIETNIMSNGIITKEQLIDNAKNYPMKRHGRAEEVARAIVYLLSDASSFITGTNLVIDGGISQKI